MSWYSADYQYREAVSVYHSGNTTTNDIEFTVASDMPRFWDRVASNNADVVLCASDGKTVLDFAVSTWNYSNKSATIQINDYALPNGSSSISGKTFIVWMYWGFDDGAGGSPVSVQNSNLPALSSEITTTTVQFGDPARAGSAVIGATAEAPEATTPSKIIPSAPGQKFHVYWDVTRHLAARRTIQAGGRQLEEIDTVDFLIEDSSSNTAGGMVTPTETRVLQPGIIRTTITTDAADVSSNYLLTLTLITDIGRTFKFFGLLKVRKITAPAA